MFFACLFVPGNRRGKLAAGGVPSNIWASSTGHVSKAILRNSPFVPGYRSMNGLLARRPPFDT